MRNGNMQVIRLHFKNIRLQLQHVLLTIGREGQRIICRLLLLQNLVRLQICLRIEGGNR